MRTVNVPFSTVASALILSACVAGSTLPSQNLTTLLSPAAGDKPALEVAQDQQALQKSADAVQSETLSTGVQSALVPAQTDETSAKEAVQRIAIHPTAPTPPENITRGTQPDIAKLTPTTPPAPSQVTVSEQTQVAALLPTPRPTPPPIKPKSSGGFFSNFFAPRPKKPVGTTDGNARKREQSLAVNKANTTSSSRTASQPSKAAVTVVKSNRTVRQATTQEGLPGVSLRRLFGVEREKARDLEQPIKVASVANLARRGTHGLLLQHKGVRVGCFPPKLVRLLKQVERRFGRTPIVTSGYRSRAHNRRIRGARNSMHVQCKAADIQVKGVSKWRLARYLRSLPGRGGVGTYCHTKSVHIDISKKRDWNRRCRSKRRARRRS